MNRFWERLLPEEAGFEPLCPILVLRLRIQLAWIDHNRCQGSTDLRYIV